MKNRHVLVDMSLSLDFRVACWLSDIWMYVNEYCEIAERWMWMDMSMSMSMESRVGMCGYASWL
jgi:hypothetical protein